MSRERSPFATSPRTDVASLTGQAIFSTSELTESTATAHDPPALSDAALRRLPFEPYAPIHAPEFVHQRIVLLDEGVEGVRDLADHPVGHTICGQANRKVSLLGRPKSIP